MNRDPLSSGQTEALEDQTQRWKDERMMALVKHLDDYRLFKFVQYIADTEGHEKFQADVERLEGDNFMIHNVRMDDEGRPYFHKEHPYEGEEE